MRIRVPCGISLCRQTAPKCCGSPVVSRQSAVLICAPLERLDADVAQMREAMREASSVILRGFELRSDARVVPYPDRYSDSRGTVMWRRVMGLLGDKQQRAAA